MEAIHDSLDLLAHFFIKEMEHTWRIKFPDCQEFVNKEGVDQMSMIVDLKGIKLKDLSNKKMLMAFRQITLELQRFFPEFVHKIYCVNTPVFFDNLWEDQLSNHIAPETIKKIIFSSGPSSPELLEDVDEYDLPDIYDGQSVCKATCVYADKGPWSEVENLVNY